MTTDLLAISSQPLILSPRSLAQHDKHYILVVFVSCLPPSRGSSQLLPHVGAKSPYATIAAPNATSIHWCSWTPLPVTYTPKIATSHRRTLPKAMIPASNLLCRVILPRPRRNQRNIHRLELKSRLIRVRREIRLRSLQEVLVVAVREIRLVMRSSRFVAQ